MQLNTLKRKTPNMTSAQVGRGGKRGKTSGRGTKGQNARSGRKKRPELRDFIKRLPKLRGYSFKSFQAKVAVVSLATIEKNFKTNDTVEPKTLVAKGLVNRTEGNFPRVKILADGEITKKVVISGCEVSLTAKAAIEKAGGKVHVN